VVKFRNINKRRKRSIKVVILTRVGFLAISTSFRIATVYLIGVEQVEVDVRLRLSVAFLPCLLVHHTRDVLFRSSVALLVAKREGKYVFVHLLVPGVEVRQLLGHFTSVVGLLSIRAGRSLLSAVCFLADLCVTGGSVAVTGAVTGAVAAMTRMVVAWASRKVYNLVLCLLLSLSGSTTCTC